MKNTKHTQGQWEWGYSEIRYTNRLTIDAGSALPLAEVIIVNGNTGEAEANAKLIASAPELLAELTGNAIVLESILRNMLDGIPVNISVIEKMLQGHKEAIKKATM